MNKPSSANDIDTLALYNGYQHSPYPATLAPDSFSALLMPVMPVMPDPYSKKKSTSTYITTSAPAIRVYLGGSFDPVHQGHMQMAMYAYHALAPIAEQQQRALHISLLPNARSPFKTQSTNPEHRLAMLKLAIKDTPLQISELELWQTPPVYTIDSVRTLSKRYPHDSLIFIMGMDSARGLTQWKNGLQLTDYVSLWIFDRNDDINQSSNSSPPTTLINNNPITPPVSQPLSSEEIMALWHALPSELQALSANSPIELIALANKTSKTSPLLKNSTQGRIYIDPRPLAAVSSTQIRQQLRQPTTPSNITPTAQMQITSLQPINDIISNTASNPLTKWLNPAVYQYIIAHQLYSAAQFR